jgi:hypothetical protein
VLQSVLRSTLEFSGKKEEEEEGLCELQQIHPVTDLLFKHYIQIKIKL